MASLALLPRTPVNRISPSVIFCGASLHNPNSAVASQSFHCRNQFRPIEHHHEPMDGLGLTS